MRFLILVLSLLGLSATTALAEWQNGELSQGAFYWSNGGGDPYHGTAEHAFRLAGIDDARVLNLLLAAVSANPHGNADRYTIQDGDRLGVMVSGSDGWVARNTVAWTSSWVSGRPRTASVWYVLDPETGVQYRLMKADVCGNWIIEYYGAAKKCRCQIGDAC